MMVLGYAVVVKVRFAPMHYAEDKDSLIGLNLPQSIANGTNMSAKRNKQYMRIFYG